MRLNLRLPILATAAIAGLAFSVTVAPAALASPATAGTTTVWTNHQYGAKGGSDTSVATSPDGSAIYVAGYMHRREYVIGAVISAYNAATGAPLWQYKNFKGTGNQSTTLDGIAVSPDGSTVLAYGDLRLTPGSPYQGWIVAVDAATGAALWSVTETTANDITAMTVSPDGSSVFVSGDYDTVAYNTATGATLWTVPGSFSSVAASSDGTAVYVTGTEKMGTGGHQRSDYLTEAYNAGTGAMLWSATYDVAKGTSVATAIAASPNGTAVFVTGTARGSSGVADLGTVAYNPATGARLWVRLTHSPAGSIGAKSLVVSPDGTALYAIGGIPSANGGAYFTAAYNAATGAPLWTARYNGPASASGGCAVWDAAVSPDGTKVFVTGSSWSTPAEGAQPQYATVAYDAGTGAQLWAARYGHGDEQPATAVSMAVSPDGGTVFVTGDTRSNGTTLAYKS